MCILFLHTDPEPGPGKFRLILASNREEFFRRPTKPAAFWEEDKCVIGGRDMEPGKEGGTWLGMSMRGRLAALLNISSLKSCQHLQGRGSLVSDFVKEGDGATSALGYLSTVASKGEVYSPFNLLAIHIRPRDLDVCYYSNSDGCPVPRTLGCGMLALGNCSLDCPLRKVTGGRDRFQATVAELGRVETRDRLVDELTQLLRWKHRHFPDEALDRFLPNVPPGKKDLHSSVFVNVAEMGFGTRTHSVILIDDQDNVDYVEWTMEEPIQAANPTWIKQHFSGKITY